MEITLPICFTGNSLTSLFLADHSGKGFPNTRVRYLMLASKILQGQLFFLIFQPLQACLQMRCASGQFGESALPEDLVEFSAQPEFDEIVDDRKSRGFQDGLRGT